MESSTDAGMLSPYRVLDLTHEWGLLSGKILADLGADVIQIEPPSGHPARRMGPYYRNEVHPEPPVPAVTRILARSMNVTTVDPPRSFRVSSVRIL